MVATVAEPRHLVHLFLQSVNTCLDVRAATDAAAGGNGGGGVSTPRRLFCPSHCFPAPSP
eukprot:5889770-Pyramimonas_sp.AAC.1